MSENNIFTVKIKRIINECKGVKTFIFNVRDTDLVKNYKKPRPGQFLMIWVPGVDEIPMSISGYDEQGNWSITVKDVGECTHALHELTIGDYIGIRGPLGNSFTIPINDSKIYYLIGGGIGMAPLRFLATELNSQDMKFTVIEGGRVYEDLIFVDEFYYFQEMESKAYFCTDDGSYGLEGFATDVFIDLISHLSEEERKKIIVYTCGPEIMMYKVFLTCKDNNLPIQASLERIMRCGCGLCGLCVIDPIGSLVCQDGPVFNYQQLEEMKDFGHSKRDVTGKKSKFNDN